jgi:hypothetical protein
MNASRQSNIAEKLREFNSQGKRTKDTDYVKEAVIPPTKITIE